MGWALLSGTECWADSERAPNPLPGGGGGAHTLKEDRLKSSALGICRDHWFISATVRRTMEAQSTKQPEHDGAEGGGVT